MPLIIIFIHLFSFPSVSSQVSHTVARQLPRNVPMLSCMHADITKSLPTWKELMVTDNIFCDAKSEDALCVRPVFPRLSGQSTQPNVWGARDL